ncbi:MAG: TolC family protein [Syntrophorhabdaceae bacterium]
MAGLKVELAASGTIMVTRTKYYYVKFILCSGLFFALLFAPYASRSITLDEAIKNGLGESYVVKEQAQYVKAYRFSYISSIDPFLPRIDLDTSYIRTISPTTPISTFTGNLEDATSSRNAYTFTGTVSWRIFDGGERFAKRRGAFSAWERETERFKSVREDVLYNIKSAFYVALGAKGVVGKRQEALRSTQKIYNLIQGRYEEGVAKKSELLQAEVRLLNAKIDIQRAQKEYEKSLETVRSLIIVDTPDPFDVDGALTAPSYRADYKALNERALRIKPEIITQQKEVDRLTSVYDQTKSAWYPKIDSALQQTRQDTRFFPEGRTDAFIISLTFPLFDGVGRYYNMQGAMSNINASRQRLAEIKRTTSLDIARALKDYELSIADVSSFSELVREATSNFNQLYGEYLEGKGDILNLLQSEKDLAAANESYVGSLARSRVALSNLERTAYIEGRP